MNLTIAQPSVTHLLAPAEFGGLESVVGLLARGQHQAGSDVTVAGVFLGGSTDTPFWRAIEESGARAIPLVVHGNGRRAERRGVREILSGTGCQVLHTHGYRPDILDAPVARRLGVATVTTVHGFTGGGPKMWAYEWLQRRAFRSFDAVVAVSAKLSGQLVSSGVPRDRVHTVRNAWDSTSPILSRSAARELLGIEGGYPVVGWVGRMSSEKAPDLMIRAFGGLEDPRVRLSMVGDGPMREQLEGLGGPESRNARVRWHGVVPEAGKYLRAFDVIAITSWTEGTPIVLLEAMAAGVPIVTTRVGGIPDVVSSREAILVEPGDEAGIRDALKGVLAGEAVVGERASAATRRLEESFGVGPWIERYRKIYASCLAG